MLSNRNCSTTVFPGVTLLCNFRDCVLRWNDPNEEGRRQRLEARINIHSRKKKFVEMWSNSHKQAGNSCDQPVTSHTLSQSQNSVLPLLKKLTPPPYSNRLASKGWLGLTRADCWLIDELHDVLRLHCLRRLGAIIPHAKLIASNTTPACPDGDLLR